MGPVATPESIAFAPRLPKARSGKIMRRVLAAVASGGAVGDVSTLEEEASLEEVQQAYADLKGRVQTPCWGRMFLVPRCRRERC